MTVLGIETSFDDTAVAVVRSDGAVLASQAVSQAREHTQHGGIVPAAAGPLHEARLPGVLEAALAESGVGRGGLDAVAVTAGPGLSHSLHAGVAFAAEVATGLGVPLVPVHHMEAHALTGRLADRALQFPFVALLASGGHCILLGVEGPGRVRRLGEALDDAPGEAYDKVARMMGLPGGRELEAVAAAGDACAHHFETPLRTRRDCHFSFAGLKSAVARAVALRALGRPLHGPLPWRETAAAMRQPHNHAFRAGVAAGFQRAVGEHLCDRVRRALVYERWSRPAGTPRPTRLVFAGGVACNEYLRARLAEEAGAHRVQLVVPPPPLCVDNGAMIAWAAIEHLEVDGGGGGGADPAALRYRPSWPLGVDEAAAVAAASIPLGVKQQRKWVWAAKKRRERGGV